MRIVGGKFRGRNIHAPANLPVRPTTDFAKTALFNILSNHFDMENISVLDLFTGTGNISFEFISRGASDVTSVDENFKCIDFIKKTIAELKITNMKALRSDAFSYVRKASGQWDIIFADPPFALKETTLLPDLILEGKILKQDGWLIVEHQSKQVLNSRHEPIEIRKYGNLAYTIYKSYNDRTHQNDGTTEQ